MNSPSKPKKPKVIIIVGTTASGKSALAIDIALKWNGEIVSADSRQIYRNLDIGTAKVTKAEMKGVPHHLIDIVDVGTTYTAQQFAHDGDAAIRDIVARGKTPIIAGGTFFYIDTLLGRLQAPEVVPNEALREELESQSTETLFEKLQKLDPRRAATIDGKNKRRLVRALEIIETLGTVPTPKPKNAPYETLILGIATEKETLLHAFEKRARTWLQNGFTKEVSSLLERGITKKQLQEIGFEYQLGVELISGALTQDAFIKKFVEKNWQYAKRQRTWLKRDKSIHWVYPNESAEIELMVEQFLRR